MITVAVINKTCIFAPTQWEGATNDGRPVYVRYRWGHLSISIGERGDSLEQIYLGGKEIFGATISDIDDCEMQYEELIKLTGHLIEWPESDGENA